MSHIELAEMAARESMVLLKNANNTLPINPTTVHKIAVIGANVTYTRAVDAGSGRLLARNCPLDFSTNVRTGDLGSSRVFSRSRQGDRAVRRASWRPRGTGITVTRSQHGQPRRPSADFVVVVAGLTPEDEGEEYTGAGDRTTRPPGSPMQTVEPGPRSQAQQRRAGRR